MALNQKIRLQIISALDDAGIKATADQLEKLQSKVENAGASAQGLGKQMSAAFNPMEAVMSVATGNVNGIIKSFVQLGLTIKGIAVSVGTMTMAFGGIMLAVTGVQKLIAHFRSAKEEAEKLAKATAENFAKRTEDATKALNAEYTNQVRAVEDVCKKKNAELDINQKLIESEIRLAKAKAGASKEEIDAAIAESRAKNDAAKAANEVAMGGDVKAVREKYIEKQKQNLSAMGEQLASYERQAMEKIDAQRKLLRDQEAVKFAASVPGATPEDMRKHIAGTGVQRRIAREMEQWKKDNKDKLFDTEINALVKGIDAADKAIKSTEADIAEAERKRGENEKLRLSTINLQVAEEIKAEQEERKKMQDELHRQRMEQLKTETSELSAAKTRFEKEFALYKSGNAAQQIEAEKKDEEARKQLQKDASRYGGKWRIAELSRLYAANDEEGVKNTLAEWRKRKSFTPEVEAMVRAAAAGENVKTMEDRVAEIADNTKDLAAKVEELLTMKGE